MLSSSERPVEFTRALAEESLQRKAIQYDRDGDAHYDSISALIKSIRGSDPDAALYWLARMLEGGEDVRFLARRLVILASEDVGNADPAALPLAVAAAQACELVGLPECQLDLGPGGDLSGLCAEVQRGHGRHRRGPQGRGAKAACCPCRSISAIRTTPARSGWGKGRTTSTRTTPKAALPRRTIWASIASTIGRSIAVSRRSWSSG